jgi:FkbM family methyltransferase
MPAPSKLGSLARRMKRRVERMTGLHLYRGVPHGIEPAADVRRLFPGREIRTVFDVGANVGQSAERLRAWFPSAEIHCFEPIEATFRQLESRVSRLGRVQCHRLALGAEARDASMIRSEQSVTSRIAGDTDGDGDGQAERETVRVERLDQFCRARDIEQIDYLKIDAEGHDLQVVHGAGDLIVDFVQIEAGFNRSSENNIPFEVVLGVMTGKGYLLFGLYEQVQRWPDGQALRRADPVFVARRLCRAV